MVTCRSENSGWIGYLSLNRSSLTFWHASSMEDSIFCSSCFSLLIFNGKTLSNGLMKRSSNAWQKTKVLNLT